MEYDELEKIKNKIEVKRTIIIIWIFIDLIIIVGIIFASATHPGSVIKTPGSKMSQQEKDIYNANIKPYCCNSSSC